MKTPLHLQLTEHDNVQITLLNALTYLLEREVIPLDLVRKIYTESDKPLKDSITWINEFTSKNNLSLKCTILTGNEVTLEKIRDATSIGGLALVKCYQGNEHYIIITEIDEASAYIFDSNYQENSQHIKDADVAYVSDEPFKFNCIVHLTRVLSFSKKDYALGEVEQRECIIFTI